MVNKLCDMFTSVESQACWVDVGRVLVVDSAYRVSVWNKMGLLD